MFDYFKLTATVCHCQTLAIMFGIVTVCWNGSNAYRNQWNNHSCLIVIAQFNSVNRLTAYLPLTNGTGGSRHWLMKGYLTQPKILDESLLDSCNFKIFLAIIFTIVKLIISVQQSRLPVCSVFVINRWQFGLSPESQPQLLVSRYSLLTPATAASSSGR